MRIPAFLELAQRELQTLDLRRLGDVIDGGDIYLFAYLQTHHLLIIDIDDLIRIFDDRRSVGREEVLLLSYPDDQRRTFAGSDECIRVRLVQHRDSVSTDDLLQG